MSEFVSFLTSLSLWGSIVNALTVILGSAVGLLVGRFIKKGSEDGIMQQVSDALMKGVGLCVLLIGISGAIQTQNVLIVIISIVIGAVIGTLCRLETGIEKLGGFVEAKAGGRFGNVAQGFVSATLLFCVGSMAIVGSLNSGLSGDHTMLYTKSLLDMIAAFVFATTLGFGVLFSSVMVLLYQGIITLLAAWVAPFLNEVTITEMSAVGSLLIIGLALNMLGITKLKVMNYIPAIFVPIFLCMII